MISAWHGGRRLGAVILALGLLLASTGNAFAHARYDRSEPADGATVDGQPFILKAYFTQELTSKSTLRVLDVSGVQVDLGDGHVDLNDPDRKTAPSSRPRDLPAPPGARPPGRLDPRLPRSLQGRLHRPPRYVGLREYHAK